ncbi:MAG: hypothetical protein WAL45_06825 [Terracidiphilus sp.]
MHIRPAGSGRVCPRQTHFVCGVHREDIVQGAEELGVDLDAYIGFCIEAMRKRAEALGL